MTTEKGTGRRNARTRKVQRRSGRTGRVGSTTRRKKSALNRARRALSAAGFSLGRKLVISESGRAIAIAFPNYIRATASTFRMPDEAGIADLFALIALHYAETEF